MSQNFNLGFSYFFMAQNVKNKKKNEVKIVMDGIKK